jgi:predicted RNA-binding Zn-ribbon protein involved in translation (DUF1610 family)
MTDNGTQTGKAGRKFDSAYGFSFSIALGLILFIAGLVISLTLGLGEGNSIGLFFGIPLLVIGLILPLFMMRDVLKSNEVSGACPYCGAPIKTSDATLRLNCPACNRVIVVRDEKLEAAE